MESEQDALEYDAMDFSEVNLAFAERALELAPARGRILDVGTGTARIPIVMMQQSRTGISIHAIDLSPAMLKVARQNVAEHGLGARISLQRVDAKGLPFADGEFDMVISNSVVHHVPDPSTFFAELIRVVRKGGGIFVRDLMRPGSAGEVDLLVTTYAGDADAYQQKLYRDSLHASLTIPEVISYVAKAGITGAQVVQSSDRHWSLERLAAV
jgi:ubiquinone/menaquinone biosynthesis C-methylase UbiE